MLTKRIFISCGQRTEKEKTLGQEIQALIIKHDMDGFFADQVHDALDLNTSLFRELQNCNGLVAVMQKRGEVHDPEFNVNYRGSVWIHQEIAILFYRSFLLQQPIPMRIYVEKGILTEGLTNFSIINPIQFERKDAILTDLSSWLGGSVFEQPPVLARREHLFRQRVKKYKDHHWLLLEIIAAHSRNPGDQANHSIVLNDFLAALREAGAEEAEAKRSHGAAFPQLETDGLILSTHDNRGGISYDRIETQWWDLVIDELRNRARHK